jgi:hypothetical protein
MIERKPYFAIVQTEERSGYTREPDFTTSALHVKPPLDVHQVLFACVEHGPILKGHPQMHFLMWQENAKGQCEKEKFIR